MSEPSKPFEEATKVSIEAMTERTAGVLTEQDEGEDTEVQQNQMMLSIPLPRSLR